MKELKSSKAVADVNVDTYDAIYVPGKFYVPLINRHHGLIGCGNASILLAGTGTIVATMVRPGDAWRRWTWHCDRWPQ